MSRRATEHCGVISETADYLRATKNYAKASLVLRELGQDAPDVTDPEPEPPKLQREKLTFTPPEIAVFLGVTPLRVRRALESGKLYGRKFSRQWFVPKAALEAFLEGRVYEPPAVT